MKNSVYKNKGRQIYLCSCKGSRIFCFAKNKEVNTSPHVGARIFYFVKNKEVYMQVDTRWFGTVDIDDNKIVTFDLGIIGFEDCKKFTLIYDVEKGDEAAIMWL